MENCRGFFLIDLLITLSIVSILLASEVMITRSILSTLEIKHTAVALFSKLQAGRCKALAEDTDVVFQMDALQGVSSSHAALSISNAAGIGFTDHGTTKFAATIRINNLTAPAVSLGVGYGKVTLK